MLSARFRCSAAVIAGLVSLGALRSYGQRIAITPTGQNTLHMLLVGQETVPPRTEALYYQYRVAFTGSLTVDAMRHVDSLDGGELLTIETSDGRNMSVAKTELKDGTIIATTKEGPVYTIYELDSTMNGRIRLNPPTPPPAPAPAKTASPTDTATATKQDIQDAQQKLRALRYDVGPADGLMGAKTTTAIKKFQSDRGLPVTGIPDAKTLEALKR